MLKANPAAGTYDYARRADRDRELGRLQRQAGIAVDQERAMWKQAGLADGMRVLDLGCGPGVAACTLAGEVPAGSVTGLDISEELLAQANLHRTQLGIENLAFQRGSVYELPFADDSFDFVYGRFVFQHLADPTHALAEIRRVLKPGGRICIMDVDDRFLLVSPEPAGFAAFRDATVAAQRADGGDREIGGALYGLLRANGFPDARTLVNVIRSEDCGVKTFLDVAIRFRANRLLGRPDLLSPAALAEALRQLQVLESTPGAWGAVGMFVGVGLKGA